MFLKKKQRIKSLLDDEECIKAAMGVVRGGSSSTTANLRLLGLILFAAFFLVMYFYFLFSGGSSSSCGFGRRCRNKAEELSYEIDRAIASKEEDQREQDMRYFPINDYPPISMQEQEDQELRRRSIAPSEQESQPLTPSSSGTSLGRIVFGIAASASLWEKRREYVKQWWRPGEMRGYVWLDKPVSSPSSTSLPPMKVSEDTSRFNYTNRKGGRSAIRISRVVSETFRLGLPDVDWFVMGDDDTVFVPENLVRVLSKYDHRKFFYVGSQSESHTQNIHFSYNMAYGGGGFAISYPLAKALEKIQDRCIQRYPYLYGSDDRIQACLAELGVPLTREPGFHQFDIYGDAFGLLAAHPVTPLVSIHHLDLIDPIFPNSTQVEAVSRLEKSMRVDPGGVLQQSICYDRWRRWSVSVSWGYAVQVYRGIIPPRTLELPMRTFLSWYRTKEDIGFPFSSRVESKNPCEQPEVFFMNEVGYGDESGETLSSYVRERRGRTGECKSKMQQHSPSTLERVSVFKQQASETSHLSPRRQCCRVISNGSKSELKLSVGDCGSDETIV